MTAPTAPCDIVSRRSLVSSLRNAEVPLVFFSNRTGEVDVDGLKVSSRVLNSALRSGVIQRYREDASYVTFRLAAVKA